MSALQNLWISPKALKNCVIFQNSGKTSFCFMQVEWKGPNIRRIASLRNIWAITSLVLTLGRTISLITKSCSESQHCEDIVKETEKDQTLFKYCYRWRHSMFPTRSRQKCQTVEWRPRNEPTTGRWHLERSKGKWRLFVFKIGRILSVRGPFHLAKMLGRHIPWCFKEVVPLDSPH